MNEPSPFLKYFFHYLTACSLLLMRQAQDVERPAEKRLQEKFQRMDKDGNGQVSLKEFSASPRLSIMELEKVERLFIHLDKNQDAALTLSELPQHREKEKRHSHRDGSRLEKIDTDKDGKISLAEFSASPPPHLSEASQERIQNIFSLMDRDQDGFLTPKERPNSRLGEPGEKRRPLKKALGKRFWERMDTNGDDLISREEFDARPAEENRDHKPGYRFFDHLDTNKDGFLSEGEREASPSKRPQGKAKPHGDRPHGPKKSEE